MSLTETYWSLKNIFESKDKHKRRDQNERNVLFGWNSWNSYQFASSVRTEGFGLKLFTHSYVEQSPFYWVNRDKGCMLFHLLKFMMWVSHSSQYPKRRHFCIVLPLSHQACAFSLRGSRALFCHYHDSARKKKNRSKWFPAFTFALRAEQSLSSCTLNMLKVELAQHYLLVQLWVCRASAVTRRHPWRQYTLSKSCQSPVGPNPCDS